MEAIKVCESSGYKVSAAVVDDSGVLRFFAKGDKSTIHTKDASFRKAYTVVTMGPIFKFDASSQFVERFSKNPSPPALASLPNIALLPGAVAIRAKGEIVAALGIGGAAGGDKDEICAQAGLEKIIDRLPR
ncbi:MAG: heme-binding protein [Betaproteobacteria bacterium]|nr:heme-binding protein [Betaproteobacteria bacterium]